MTSLIVGRAEISSSNPSVEITSYGYTRYEVSRLCCAFNVVHVPSAQLRVGTTVGHRKWERDRRFWQLDSLLDAADG